MTKEQFENFSQNTVYCESCKKWLLKEYVSYRNLRLNGTVTRCNLCDWLEKHKDRLDNVEIGKAKAKIIAEHLIFQKSLYINDLIDKTGLELDSIIETIQELKIANKKYRVKSNCCTCGAEVEATVSVYIKNQNLFCSRECYWEHKRNTATYGENNRCYNRIETECTNCGKTIKVIPYSYNKHNTFGDNHNFCSHECYWAYRGKYYRGEKSHRFNTTISDENLQKMKIGLAKYQKESKRLNSKIQLKTNDILDHNQISYEREYVIAYYSIDNYLSDYGLMIEVMGDYWHTSPVKYFGPQPCINEIQQRSLHHDKLKYGYIKKHYRIEILYLWESDINANPELCERLILKYIENNGKLDNYHSFNWTIIGNELKLKNEIIIPYQGRNIDSYRNLFNKKKNAG